MNILVVEDEKEIREGIKEYLEEFKYNIFEAADGGSAINVFNENDINLILLDINIPVLNGLNVLKKIREKSTVPILILTAYDDDQTKIEAFNNMCDGYIEKPFSLPVLKSRINASFKRYYSEYKEFEYKDAKVDFLGYKAYLNGKEVDLKTKEFQILKYLIDNKNIVLSRSQIIDGVWENFEDIPYDRVVDVYVKELRKKLELDCIKTVRNVGYKIEI